ncbi:MAG: peptide-methionine (S)-S-oxide reductase MsrA [Acidobacteriota bacterium]
MSSYLSNKAVKAIVVVLIALAGIALIAFGATHGPTAATPQARGALVKATFAGGCFWCMEPPFERMKGVVSVTSGYTGGRNVGPTYEQVSSGATGHYESVEVLYDPRQVSYGQLLDVFWHNVDPTNDHGQFCDEGGQYRTAIFFHDGEQKQLAEASKTALQKRMTVVTNIIPAGPFYAAEEYHQDYYKKNPVRYRFYRFNCGRDHRLAQIWGSAPAH